MRYPGGIWICDCTACCASCTKPTKSRPCTKASTTENRAPFSRSTVARPSARCTLARSESCTCFPLGETSFVCPNPYGEAVLSISLRIRMGVRRSAPMTSPACTPSSRARNSRCRVVEVIPTRPARSKWVSICKYSATSFDVV